VQVSGISPRSPAPPQVRVARRNDINGEQLRKSYNLNNGNV
jgi:hypothetical protein